MPRVFKSTKPQSAQRMILTVEVPVDPHATSLGNTVNAVTGVSLAYLSGYLTDREMSCGHVTHVRMESVDA